MRGFLFRICDILNYGQVVILINNMASNLKSQSPITIDTRAIPQPELLENLPILHQFLEEILKDWHRAVEPYEARIEKQAESAEYIRMIAFTELQPAFLKCLFSYVFFFDAANQAYKKLYANLNTTKLRISHNKPPKETVLVKKAQLIRDTSIAHFPSDKASHIDSIAAMSWSPMTLSGQDLRRLTFGGFKLSCIDKNGNATSSSDLEIQGLDDLHKECINYLEAFDTVCVDYMNNIRNTNHTL